MTPKKLKEIITNHERWLDDDGGKKANLSRANLSATESILLTPFGWCHAQKENIRIGCQYHTTEEWRNFSDEEIGEMASRALDWWKRNKPVVMAMADACEPYPA